MEDGQNYRIEQHYGHIRLSISAEESSLHSLAEISLDIPHEVKSLDDRIQKALIEHDILRFSSRESAVEFDYLDSSDPPISYKARHYLESPLEAYIELKRDSNSNRASLTLSAQGENITLENAIGQAQYSYLIIENALEESGINISDVSSYIRDLSAEHLRNQRLADLEAEPSMEHLQNLHKDSRYQGQDVLSDTQQNLAPHIISKNNEPTVYSEDTPGHVYSSLLAEDPDLRVMAQKPLSQIHRAILELRNESRHYHFIATTMPQSDMDKVLDYSRSLRITNLMIRLAEKAAGNSHFNPVDLHDLHFRRALSEAARGLTAARDAESQFDFSLSEREAVRTRGIVQDIYQDLITNIKSQIRGIEKSLSTFSATTHDIDNTHVVDLKIFARKLKPEFDYQLDRFQMHIGNMRMQMALLDHETSRFSPKEIDPDHRMDYFLRTERFEDAQNLAEMLKLRDYSDPLELFERWLI